MSLRCLGVAVVAIAGLLASAAAALATPPGREGRIAFFSNEGNPFVPAHDLFTAKPDGSDRRLLAAGVPTVPVSWSRDGRTLAFVKYDGIYVARSDGSHARRVTSTWTEFALAPNGRTLVIDRNLPDRKQHNLLIRPDLVALDLKTGRERLIGYDAEWPTFSPDGRWIAFTDERVTNPHRYSSIGVVRLDGRHRHLVYRHGGSEGADWSPDGARLAWTQQSCPGGRDCRELLRVMTLHGHHVKTLVRRGTGRGAFGTGLSWSPAGRRLVTDTYVGTANGGDRLVTVSATSGRVHRLRHDTRGEWPVWQPRK